MAIPVKAILLERTDKLGTGLTALRSMQSSAIDITEFADSNAFGDGTASTTKAYIIKDNKAYTVMRTFIDLDTNCRYIIAKNEGNSFDRWPIV